MSMDQGLILQQPDAREEVLTDKDIYLHAVGVLPQLRLAMQQSTEPRQGSGWIRHPKKDGIVIKEYQPMQTLTDQPAGSSWPDTSMSYAVLAECDIKCHVNEVMDVIFSDEAAHHDAAMTAVWGASYQRGDLLFSKSLDKGDRIWNVVGDNDLTSEQEGFFEYVQPGWISVKSASLRPRHTARLTTTLNRPQKLCFATYSRRSLMDDEAVYVMKTLPLPAHDQLIMRSQCSALQNGVDHIGVGYHFKSYYGHISGYSTRVVVFAYVNCASDDDRSSELRFKHGNIDTRAIANMDARKTVMLLARAARKFERIIRRRRLGHQRFVYFPIDRDNILESDCSICQKHFGLFRKDFYCQLCGHLTCRECSGKYDVEAIPGVIQKNRICFGCIARVENCLFEHAPKFDPSGLSASRITAAGLDEGPPRNKDDDLASSQHSFFSKKSEQLLAEDLFGADRETRAQAFKAIKQAVREAQDPRSPVRCGTESPSLHAYVSRRSSVARTVLQSTSGTTRSFSVTNPSTSRSDDGMSRQTKRRPQPAIDSSALATICEVASQRTGCPITFVALKSSMGHTIIASHQAPGCAYHVRWNDFTRSKREVPHSDHPFVVKNPVTDSRMRQLPQVEGAVVRFCAGFPAKDRNGTVLATLYALDVKPRQTLSKLEYSALASLARLAAELVQDCLDVAPHSSNASPRSFLSSSHTTPSFRSFSFAV